jgi:lipopolysaccharide assembly outer membrane protein LptD (OstA)
MKSNYLSFFYLQLILMISSLNALASEEFNFKAKNIQTISKDLIIATQNVNISDNFGNNIFADKLEINKQKLKHKITGNIRFFDNSNNRATGEILIIDEKNNLATLEGNVVLINEIKQLEINTDKIKFNLIDNTLLTGKDTKIVKDKIYILNGGQILFDKNKETLASNDNSILFDDVGNKIEIRNFILKIKEN